MAKGDVGETTTMKRAVAESSRLERKVRADRRMTV
jgi:hypothetical protein